MFKIYKLILILILFLLIFPVMAEEEVSKQDDWCSLKSNTVNVRTGPGKQYPIKWIYKRCDMPMKILAKYEQWVKIEDFEGTTGWVHPSMVSGKKTFIVLDDYVYLKKYKSEDSSYIAKLEKGVIGDISDCDEDLCEVSVGDWEGYLLKDKIWGIE